LAAAEAAIQTTMKKAANKDALIAITAPGCKSSTISLSGNSGHSETKRDADVRPHFMAARMGMNEPLAKT